MAATMTQSSHQVAFSETHLPTQLFINNRYTESASNKTISVRNPKDNSLISDQVPLAQEEDVNAAVAAAEAAFQDWKGFSANKRRGILEKFACLLEENKRTLASLNRIAMGAPFKAFGDFETSFCVETFRYYAGWIDKYAGESLPAEDGFLKIIRHEPLGVTAGIIPWNGPLALAALKAAPALATGNCFILKPSEKTPFAALALGDLITAAGFPPGVFQILSGDGTTGAILARHERIRKISFTGSCLTGKKIQKMAAESNLKRVTLELGGKSPAVIFDDCNLDNAVEWCVNAIAANTGQVCFAATRIYVQRGIKERFLSKYKAALEARGRTAGDPELESTFMGPLVDETQFNRVTGFIERGKQEGSLVVGGKRIGSTGWFVEPTVFTDVSQDAEIYQQEIFGPVSIVNTFDTEEEALEKANATEFGLMAGVFTQDINRALRMASEFDSGMVGINCVSQFFLTAPFGGTKQSGIGRECGRQALDLFTETKTVFVNLTYK